MPQLVRPVQMAKANDPQLIVKPPSAEGLAASATRAGKGSGPAPVHLWNPPFCGDLDIRIARDGTWSYLGTPIGRPALVRLFSNILKREGDRFYLVTPAEKVGIQVDDAPFLAVDVEVTPTAAGPALTFTTQTGDTTTASETVPIRVERDPATGEPAPYVLVRPGLEARIDRKTFYRLVDLGEIRGDWFGVRSAGAFFAIGPAADLG